VQVADLYELFALEAFGQIFHVQVDVDDLEPLRTVPPVVDCVRGAEAQIPKSDALEIPLLPFKPN
jgi:hypothetical protein